VITFDLFGVDDRQTTWPQDAPGYGNIVGATGWWRDENVSIRSVINQLKVKTNELALDVALEVFWRFG
jgi:hypothetical protein